MYSESVKSDKKDFLSVLMAVAISIVIAWILRLLIKNIMIADILSFAVIGYTAYQTLVGYCSEFVYTIDENETITLVRRISAREKIITIEKDNLIGVYSDKPKDTGKSEKYCRNFKVSSLCYIVYKSGEERKTAVCELSDEFKNRLCSMVPLV